MSDAGESSDVGGRDSTATQTYARSTPELRALISSLADSLARTSVRLDREPDSRESDPDSGSQWRTPFAYFDLGSFSSRTSPDSTPRVVPVQGSLLSEPSSPIWPRQVMWDLGYVYELLTSERPTSGNESSSLLPTPAAQDDGKSPEGHMATKDRLMTDGKRTTITSLAVLARADFRQPLLPTPGASDFNGGEGETRETRIKEGVTGGPQLKDIAHLLPTPQAHDAKVPTSREGYEKKSRRLRGAPKNLSEITRYEILLPTPTSQDSKHGLGNETEKERNPHTLWAKIQDSGEATRQPYADGNSSSDDQLPGQLTIEDV